MMRTSVKWLLGGVVVADGIAALVLVSGGIPSTLAEEHPAPASAPAVSPADAALAKVAEQLKAREAAIAARENEAQEALRAAEVLKRTAVPAPAEEKSRAKSATKKGAKEPTPPFTKLTRAYENMEPDGAARALVALAKKDREAVVDLMLGWKPRTSGAVLDAMTQREPALAAEISYEIWKRREGADATATTVAPEGIDADDVPAEEGPVEPGDGTPQP
jgi:hypothetical protein